MTFTGVDPAAYLPGTRYVVAFHPAFENTLLGLRLWQGDIPPDDSADLPRFEGRCVLASGEELPDRSTALLASRVLAELYHRALKSSYVICDAQQLITFAVESEEPQQTGRLKLDGKMFFFYWTRGPTVVDQMLDAARGRRFVYSGHQVEPATEVSQLVSSQSILLERANPAVYHAMLNTMRYAAFFRYVRHKDARTWREFLQTLDVIPVSTYRFPTPVLMRENMTAAGRIRLGRRRLNQGRWDDAIAAFDEALRLKPDDTYALATRGYAHGQKDEFGKAISDLTEALRLKPTYSFGFQLRGVTYHRRGEYDKAIADFERALELQPQDWWAQICLARLLSVCPAAKYRNGARAVELAKQACEATIWKAGWKAGYCLSTLAAACAEAGDFEQAVTWQSKAIELTPDEEDRERERELLELYKAGKPYHERSPKP